MSNLKYLMNKHYKNSCNHHIKFVKQLFQKRFGKSCKLSYLNQYRCDLELLGKFWQIKARSESPVKIKKKLDRTYNINCRKCSLCLNQKLKIIFTQKK